MKVLVIGGTGFIGRPLVRELASQGHAVTVLTRGGTAFDLPAQPLVGCRAGLAQLRPAADVVIDLILSSGRQAGDLVRIFRGAAGRVVAASSIDVYRACGILHGSEEGPIEPAPLTEDSPLRGKLQTYSPEQIKALQNVFGWLDDEYDKIPVERAILSDPQLPGTVLRLPMIYGPGDHLRRLYPLLRRMDDGRPAVLLEERWSTWRAPRGFVENVAAALALAAVHPVAAGRVYNVAEQPVFSELEWARRIAAAAGWKGEFVLLPTSRMPPHLVQRGNSEQHWEADSTRIRRELGYREPVGLDEALRRTVEWERANPAREFPLHKLDYPAEDAALGARLQ